VRTLLYVLAGVAGLALVLAGVVYLTVVRDLHSVPEARVDAEETALGNREILGWIRDITRLGPRNPGTEGGRKTRDYIARQLRSFGLRVAEPEPFGVETFTADEWQFLIADPATGKTESVPSFYIPFSAPTGDAGVSGELVYVGDGEGIEGFDLDGKIAVFEQPARPSLGRGPRTGLFIYDPKHTLKDEPLVLMQDADFERRIYEKVSGRAVGMVGLLGRMQWDSDSFFPQMNHGLSKDIPGVWIRRSLVERVRSLAKRGGVTGTVHMRSEIGRETAHNLWAELPGKTEEYYVVMGHYDSPFSGAVQDASGVSIVLALAKHFSSVREDLPLERGIVFLTVDAHTIGRVGEREFVRRHLDGILKKTALVISAEHIGKRLRPREDLSFAVSDVPSMRALLTSWNGVIPDIAKIAVLTTDYERAMVVPQWIIRATTGKARGISGEFFEAGLPVVGLLSAPPYLFFPEDTLETVAEEELVPTANLLIALIRAADRYPLSEFR
jgi:hypothetical protein